jgi:hypothetical protein
VSISVTFGVLNFTGMRESPGGNHQQDLSRWMYLGLTHCERMREREMKYAPQDRDINGPQDKHPCRFLRPPRTSGISKRIPPSRSFVEYRRLCTWLSCSHSIIYVAGPCNSHSKVLMRKISSAEPNI